MNHKNLDVWQRSMEIIGLVYRLTQKFPGSETHGIVSQLRRAAISVSANLAEGLGRQTKKDTTHFLHISRGSLYELDTLIQAAVDLKFLSNEAGIDVQTKIDACVKMVQGLIKRYKDPELR